MTSDRSGVVIKEMRSKRDLADYLTSLTGHDLSHHAMLAHYVGSEAHGRAEFFEALNCAAASKPALLAEFRREQDRKPKRGQGRSVYHFMISRRGRTDPQILASMAKRLLQLAGLDKQKALIAVHTDTDDNHVHIAVSALDASGSQIILERGYSKVLLAHINAQLCHEFGFEPEAGLGFHATSEGVFRTVDGAKLRDADFRKVTKDLRKEPAQKARSAAFEQETGLPSIQRRIRESFDQALRAGTLEMFAAHLAADRISYQLKGSGAMIGLDNQWFKASDIARAAPPKKIANRFGVTHLTQKEAERLGLVTGVGFYAPDEAGLLQPIRLPEALDYHADALLPMPGAQARWMQHNADQRLEQNLPKPAAMDSDPIRDRIKRLLDRPTPAGIWQAERLQRALHYCQGARGRPPLTPAIAHDRKLPVVNLKHDTATLVGPVHHTRWNGPPIWGGVRVRKAGPLWHVTRGSQPVATFGPGLIVVHQATPADKEHIMRLAQLDFGGDVQAHCKPADRRSWIRAAQACDVILSNPELVLAQAEDANRRQNRLARMTNRLAAAGESLIHAGRLALGEAHAALQSALPSIQRNHAQWRARSLQLSTRLSVVQERLAAEKELARRALEQTTMARAEPQPSINQPITAPARGPAFTAPVPPPVEPVRLQPQRQPEVAPDAGVAMPRGVKPTSSVPVAARAPAISHEQPKVDERGGASASLTSDPGQTQPDRSAEVAQRPASHHDARPAEIPSRLPTDQQQAPPESVPARELLEMKFHEAIKLVGQLDAVGRVEGDRFHVRLIGSDDWKIAAIPNGLRKFAEDALLNFRQRYFAVKDALISGVVTVDETGKVEVISAKGDTALPDLHKLLREPGMLEIARAAARDGVNKVPDVPEPSPAKQPEAPTISPPAATAEVLHTALRRAMRDRSSRAKQSDQLSRRISHTRQDASDPAQDPNAGSGRFAASAVASNPFPSDSGPELTPPNDTAAKRFWVIEKVDQADWRRVDRHVGPLERIEWLFEGQRRYESKRLVGRRVDEFTLPRDLLERVELGPDDIADQSVQTWLRTEHEEQLQGLSVIVEHLAARPDSMVRDEHCWHVLSSCDKTIADKLFLWRNEPVVQSALDTLRGLQPAERDSKEWSRRLEAFLVTIYPDLVPLPPPIENKTGAARAAHDISRANGFGLPTDHDGIG